MLFQFKFTFSHNARAKNDYTNYQINQQMTSWESYLTIFLAQTTVQLI